MQKGLCVGLPPGGRDKHRIQNTEPGRETQNYVNRQYSQHTLNVWLSTVKLKGLPQARVYPPLVLVACTVSVEWCTCSRLAKGRGVIVV